MRARGFGGRFYGRHSVCRRPANAAEWAFRFAGEARWCLLKLVFIGYESENRAKKLDRIP